MKNCTKIDDYYDHINPKHYKLAGMEAFDAMVKIWGIEKAIAHCEMCAFKYQMRLGKKPGQPIEWDKGKIKWYEDKAEELRAKMREEDKAEELRAKMREEGC